MLRSAARKVIVGLANNNSNISPGLRLSHLPADCLETEISSGLNYSFTFCNIYTYLEQFPASLQDQEISCTEFNWTAAHRHFRLFAPYNALTYLLIWLYREYTAQSLQRSVVVILNLVSSTYNRYSGTAVFSPPPLQKTTSELRLLSGLWRIKRKNCAVLHCVS